MNELWLVLWSVAVSGIVSFFVARASTRYDYRLSRRSRAVEQLAPHLYGLQSLVTMANPGIVASQEFVDALLGWDAAWKTHRVGLPAGWDFVDRQVKDALGTFAGVSRFAAIDRRVWSQPLGEYNWEWQVNAESYLGHVAERIARSDERRPTKPMTFDVWLHGHDVREVR